MTKKEKREAKKLEEMIKQQQEAVVKKNKKKTIIGCCIIGAAIVCTLCIVGVISKSTPNYSNMDFDKYMTVGNYKGLEYTMDVAKVTDKDVENYINNTLESFGENKEKKGAVEDGDIVTINFEGTVDGEILDSATATDYQLEIGSKTMIEGFEDSFIGHKAGDKFSVDLTFPESYSEESLAGKPVTFAMELTSVQEYIQPELNEAFVRENTEYKTVAEYRKAVRKDLEATAKSEAQSAVDDELWNKVVGTVKVTKYPKNSVKYERELLQQQQIEELEATYNMTLEEAMKQSGMSQEDYDKQMNDSAKEIVKNKMLAYYIVQKENADVSDKAYDKFRKELLTSEGYTEKSFESEMGMSFDEYCEQNDLHSSFIYTKAAETIRNLGKEVKAK